MTTERPYELRRQLGIDRRTWTIVCDAAADAHLTPVAYCRLMVLCAAGFGGVAEHVERAIEAGCGADLDLSPKQKAKNLQGIANSGRNPF